MRELLIMFQENQRAYWDPFAALISLTFNINRDPKKSKVMGPADVNPYDDRKRKSSNKVMDKKLFLQALKAQFYRPPKESKCQRE